MLWVTWRQASRLQEREEPTLGISERELADIGVCPECGYPTIRSSLCAFCPPRV